MILKNGKRIDGASIDTAPIGILSPFLGTIAPNGYLLCQGQKVSKTRYSKLYEICGDLFGTSTDTEFYLPDLRGKTVTGYKSGDDTFGTLGGLIGSLTHTHSIAHTHGVPGVAHTHTTGNHTLTVAEMPNHTHITRVSWNDSTTKPANVKGQSGTGMQLGVDQNLSTGGTGGGGAHNHGNTGSTTPSATTTNSQSTSTSGSSSTLQPSMNLNWIVKAEMVNYISSKVYNGLDSDSTSDALSAAQGKALNDKINNMNTKIEDINTRTDYTKQITCTYGELNSNFNYCFLKDGIVYINLSYILSQNLTAGTQYNFATLPTSVRPKGNVIIMAFSHKTSHMLGNYIRNTGEVVIIPEKDVAKGKEINIFTEYFIK